MAHVILQLQLRECSAPLPLPACEQLNSPTSCQFIDERVDYFTCSKVW